jgi:hypothetical protein
VVPPRQARRYLPGPLPFELESVLIEHPAAAEAAVVPAPEPVHLSVPKAYIALSLGYEPTKETARSTLAYGSNSRRISGCVDWSSSNCQRRLREDSQGRASGAEEHQDSVALNRRDDEFAELGTTATTTPDRPLTPVRGCPGRGSMPRCWRATVRTPLSCAEASGRLPRRDWQHRASGGCS